VNARRHNPPNPLATARRFLRHYHGRDCFAPFTGQDFAAWSAFVYACELYGRTDNRAMCIAAMEALVNSAQPKCAELFLWTIPAILDWSHADEVWPLIAGDVADAEQVVEQLVELHARERGRFA
jgi:hypothetical protein